MSEFLLADPPVSEQLDALERTTPKDALIVADYDAYDSMHEDALRVARAGEPSFLLKLRARRRPALTVRESLSNTAFVCYILACVKI